MYEEGQVLEKDCVREGCNTDGMCESKKAILDERDEDDSGWIGHKFGVSKFEALDLRNEIRIKDADIPCWKRVITMGGKRKRRRKTSKKGGSKRRRTRRRR